jgi:hypothetical protein
MVNASQPAHQGKPPAIEPVLISISTHFIAEAVTRHAQDINPVPMPHAPVKPIKPNVLECASISNHLATIAVNAGKPVMPDKPAVLDNASIPTKITSTVARVIKNAPPDKIAAMAHV